MRKNILTLIFNDLEEQFQMFTSSIVSNDRQYEAANRLVTHELWEDFPTFQSVFRDPNFKAGNFELANEQYSQNNRKVIHILSRIQGVILTAYETIIPVEQMESSKSVIIGLIWSVHRCYRNELEQE